MTPVYSYNLFKEGEDVLLAICDKNILGKTFESNDLQITVNEFYKGKECTAKEALEIARKVTIINAVGNKIISLLIENEIVNKDMILKIGSVSHAQVIIIK